MTPSYFNASAASSYRCLAFDKASLNATERVIKKPSKSHVTVLQLATALTESVRPSLLLPHISQMSRRALFRYVHAWHSHRADDDDEEEEGGAAAAAVEVGAVDDDEVTLGGERCLLCRELLFLFCERHPDC